MKKSQFRGVIMLFICAFVWGSSFVAQSEGMEYIEGFTFNGIRMLMGAATLIPVIVFRDLVASKKPGFSRVAYKSELVRSVKHGVIIGIILCVASNLQQFAFNYSTPGKIAFITAFYMFLVPIFGLFFRKKPPLVVWICVLIGIVGLYILCIGPAGIQGVNRGDILALCCAVAYAWHIIFIERLSPGTDAVKISCVQFFVTGVISCALMFIFEHPDINLINSCIIPLLYSGCMSCSIAYTFQIVGQKYTEPTVASLIMCLESVFGVICAAVFYRTMPTSWEIAGCVIMFSAIVLSQFSDKLTRKS